MSSPSAGPSTRSTARTSSPRLASLERCSTGASQRISPRAVRAAAVGRPATPCRRRGPRTAAAHRGRGRGDLGPQGAHEAAPSLGRRQQGGIGGRGRHVVHRAGVDAADEGVHQAVGHPPAELAGHQRADGAVADGPRTSGRGSSASRARPSWPRSPRMPERAAGQNRVGMPRARPSGRGAPARGPTRRHRARRSGPVRRPARSRGRGRALRAAGRGSRRDRYRRCDRRTSRCRARRRAGTSTP
jgi:hypothetical protein